MRRALIQRNTSREKWISAICLTKYNTPKPFCNISFILPGPTADTPRTLNAIWKPYHDILSMSYRTSQNYQNSKLLLGPRRKIHHLQRSSESPTNSFINQPLQATQPMGDQVWCGVYRRTEVWRSNLFISMSCRTRYAMFICNI